MNGIVLHYNSGCDVRADSLPVAGVDILQPTQMNTPKFCHCSLSTRPVYPMAALDGITKYEVTNFSISDQKRL